MPSILTSLYRSLARHRLYAVLNIGGLALGIAVFLVLFLFVRFETGYGRWVPGSDRLWMVHSKVAFRDFPTGFDNDSTAHSFLSLLRGERPDIRGTRFTAESVSLRNGRGAVAERMMRVDPAFFRLLPYPAVAGDPVQAMMMPGKAAITETVARTNFGGSVNAVGRTLTVTSGGKPVDVVVAAVLRDLPPDTDFKADIFIPIAPVDPTKDNWGFGDATVLLQLPDAAAAQRLEADLPAFIRRHPLRETMEGMKATLTLVPMSAVHLRETSAQTVVATLGVIGIVTLLIALVNYVNLATARAGLRAREVAMRKVLGATRRMLVAQFLGESIAATALAGIIGLALAELALPLINAAGGTSLAIRYGGAESILLPLASTVIGAGVLAGLYPALLLSRFRAAAVLASARAPGGGRAGTRLRQALVVLQFTIAAALGTGTAILIAQTHHVRSADLGFDQRGLLLIPSLGDTALDPGRRLRLLEAIGHLPGVTTVSHSSFTPAGGVFMMRTVKTGTGAGENLSMNFTQVGDGFLRLIGARLIAGRDFDSRFATDDSSHNMHAGAINFSNVILNAAAVRKLGLGAPEKAAGKMIAKNDRHSQIVGVIDDLRFNGPRNGEDAMMYIWRHEPPDSATGFVRYTGATAATLSNIEGVWRRLAPTVPFDAKTVEQARYDEFLRADAQRMRLFTMGAVLAVIIACIGLYGLASFDTARRVKEIGIRKTLGASTAEVLRLLIGQFLRPVLLGTVLAAPIAFYAMRQWLAAFADRIALSPAFFVLAGVAAVAIAAATVAGQAWRVARAEPARALRYE
ncbi:FtsX-like permease family protein [Sphingomonas sp. MA1305]|uniref:FtsX-like permease family protein n=1 Tax=Sphingomonas sp. MA1305 TaxID=2479204 RepID=UPI001E3D03C9|nr:FtsX-like permease family protein [Sphingomonas sp. MA1305]